jgi:hypothetical protein
VLIFFLILGLSYYTWVLKGQSDLIEDRIGRSVDNRGMASSDLAQLKLTFDSHVSEVNGEILQQKSELKKLSESQLRQLADFDVNLSALKTKIEGIERLSIEAGQLNELANQFERLEALVSSLKLQVESGIGTGADAEGSEVFVSRLQELEQASIALLVHALLE